MCIRDSIRTRTSDDAWTAVDETNDLDDTDTTQLKPLQFLPLSATLIKLCRLLFRPFITLDSRYVKYRALQ